MPHRPPPALPRRPAARRVLLAVAAVVLTVLLAGCGGDAPVAAPGRPTPLAPNVPGNPVPEEPLLPGVTAPTPSRLPKQATATFDETTAGTVPLGTEAPTVPESLKMLLTTPDSELPTTCPDGSAGTAYQWRDLTVFARTGPDGGTPVVDGWSLDGPGLPGAVERPLGLTPGADRLRELLRARPDATRDAELSAQYGTEVYRAGGYLARLSADGYLDQLAVGLPLCR